MLRTTVAFMLLLGAASAAGARTLHFRIEPGAEPGRVVEGALVESGSDGSGFDGALLDEDGDGEFETRRSFRETVHPRSKRPVRDTRLPLRAGEVVYTLEVDALASPAGAAALSAGTTKVHWSAQAGTLFVRFQEVPLALFESREEARAAKPLRLGPPFTVEIGAATRGWDAMVTLAVRDANGGKLSTVSRDGKENRADLSVWRGEERLVAAAPGYS